MTQGMRRVTRSAVSVAGPSAATERGGGPSLPNVAQGERPASPVGDVSGLPGPAVGVADHLLVSSIGGSEEPQKLETRVAVDGGGRVVDAEREDCSTPTNALDLDTKTCPESHPRKEGGPSLALLTWMLAEP